MQFFDDPKHLPTKVEESNSQIRTSNVAFIGNGNLIQRSELTAYTALSVRATRSICAGEVVFVS